MKMMVYECQKCQYQTSVKCNWEKHLKTKKHQTKTTNLVKNEVNEASTEVFEAKSINKHPIDPIFIQFICDHCHKNFNRKDNLLRHLRSCKLSENTKEPKWNHIYEKENEPEFKCNYCQNIYKYQKSLTRHKKFCVDNMLLKEHHMMKEKQKDLEIEQLKYQIKQLNTNNKPLSSEKNDKCPQVSTSVHNFKCFYCQNIYVNKRSLSKHLHFINVDILTNIYVNKRSLSKHLHFCQKRSEEIKNIQRENEKKIIQIEKEKEQAINLEKDKCIEIAKQTKIVNNIQNNKTINFLNQNFGSMIAMEQFLYNLEHHQKLTIDERKMLLTSFKEGDLETFYRSFNYVLKENCKRQLEQQGLKDMKLLPLYCSDGNYRSHKEKEIKGWKTKYDNKNINRMLDICNNQVFETYQELLLIAGKNLTKLYKEVKKNNHENNFDDIHNNRFVKQIIED